MSAKKIEIEFPLESTRLVFSGMGRPLVLNPRECKGSPLAPSKIWPHCGAADHQCREIYTSEISAVPLSRFLDESGDYAASWFAFWEEDCMDPPIWIVRAESFEQAYEDFINEVVSRSPLSESDLTDYEKTPDGDYEGLTARVTWSRPMQHAVPTRIGETQCETGSTQTRMMPPR